MSCFGEDSDCLRVKIYGEDSDAMGWGGLPSSGDGGGIPN